MNANILSLIFEYSNKFDLPVPTKNEKEIVANLAKTSYLQHVKAQKYNQQVKRFTQVINELRTVFGHENVLIKEYYGNPHTFENPGHASIFICGSTLVDDSISIRTDMHYIQPRCYPPDTIETFGGIYNVLHSEYVDERVWKDSKILITNISNSYYWYRYQMENPDLYPKRSYADEWGDTD